MNRRRDEPAAQRLASAQRDVDDWNDRYPVGHAVEYRSHVEAPAKTTRTRSQAFVVDENTACVMLDKVQGAVGLYACTPVGAAPISSETVYRERLRRIGRDLGSIDQEVEFAINAAQSRLDLAFHVGELVKQLEAAAAAARAIRDDVAVTAGQQQPLFKQEPTP